jgi:hypothetical protein
MWGRGLGKVKGEARALARPQAFAVFTLRAPCKTEAVLYMKRPGEIIMPIEQTISRVKLHRMKLSCLLAALLLPAPAQAEFSDPSSGFAIRPPAPFTVEPTGRRQFDVGVGIKSGSGKPAAAGTSAFVCEAGFKAAQSNTSLSVREINALVDKPEWRKLVRSTFELLGTVRSERRFTLQGHRGVELQVTPKAGPDASNVRLICNTVRRDLAKGLPQFRAIRSSMTVPK